jgi:hypothetical protein
MQGRTAAELVKRFKSVNPTDTYLKSYVPEDVTLQLCTSWDNAVKYLQTLLQLFSARIS